MKSACASQHVPVMMLVVRLLCLFVCCSFDFFYGETVHTHCKCRWPTFHAGTSDE